MTAFTFNTIALEGVVSEIRKINPNKVSEVTVYLLGSLWRMLIPAAHLYTIY